MRKQLRDSFNWRYSLQGWSAALLLLSGPQQVLVWRDEVSSGEGGRHAAVP